MREISAPEGCRDQKKGQPHPVLPPVRARHPQSSEKCLEVAHLLVLETVRRRESENKKEV